MDAVEQALADRHRRRQLDIRSALTTGVVSAVAGLNLDDIDRTWALIAPTLVALTVLHHQQSVREARDYFRAARVAAEAPGGTPDPPDVPPPDDNVLVANLTLLGPILLKRHLTRRGRNGDPLGKTQVRLVGATSRLALNGGRSTVVQAVRNDPAASGYRRVTSSSPCDFCAEIAGRGVLAKSGDGASFPAHSHCSCASAPAWRP